MASATAFCVSPSRRRRPFSIFPTRSFSGMGGMVTTSSSTIICPPKRHTSALTNSKQSDGTEIRGNQCVFHSQSSPLIRGLAPSSDIFKTADDNARISFAVVQNTPQGNLVFRKMAMICVRSILPNRPQIMPASSQRLPRSFTQVLLKGFNDCPFIRV